MPQRQNPVSTGGKPISESLAKRKLNLSIFASSMGMGWNAIAWGMPLILFMEFLGASGVIIGVIATIRQFIFTMQIPGSLISERLSSRKPFFLTMLLINRALWFFPALVPYLFSGNYELASWIVLVQVAVCATFGQAGSPAWFSWMADLIPASYTNRFWARREAITFAGFLASTMLAGKILDWFPSADGTLGSPLGFAVVFSVCAIMGIGDILTFIFIPEPAPHPAPRSRTLWQRLKAPMQEANFRRLTIAYGLWLLSLGVVGSFIPVYLKRELHVSFTDISLITIFSCLGMITVSQVWAVVIDRIGYRAFGAVVIFFAHLAGSAWFFITPENYSAAQLVGWIPVIGSTLADIGFMQDISLSGTIWILLPANFICGAFISGVNVLRNSLGTVLAPREGRTMSMAVHWSIAGMIAASGPIIGGYIMDNFPQSLSAIMLPGGTHLSYIQVILLLQLLPATGSVIMFLRIRTDYDHLPVGRAISRMFVGNPVQAVRNIYAMNSPVDRWTRVRAARKLGQKRTALAVTDLVRSLDDDSFEVREAAVSSLGDIGGNEAVEALVAELQDPESDLAPQAARSLRKTPDNRAVPILVERLEDDDRETRMESARTLGIIRNPSAALPLLELLQRAHDSRVAVAAGEALSRIGEMQAVPDLLRWMKQMQNKVFKRSMALAVSELLGRPEVFYRILAAEKESPLSGMEKMCHVIGNCLQECSAAKKSREQRHILKTRVQRLLDACEEEDYVECMEQIIKLSVATAELKFGFTPAGQDVAQLAEMLKGSNNILGEVIKALLYLQDCEKETDWLDVLLGTYLVYSRCRN